MEILTPADLALYYQALLIIQYVLKPKAAQTINLTASTLIADLIYAQVRDGFSIDAAVGAQLDILGEYRGVIREIVGFNLAKNYLQFPSVTVPHPNDFFGFARVVTPGVPSWYFLRISDSTASVFSLNDGQFSQMIQYLSVVQTAFLSLQEVDDVLDRFFGQYATMTDNEDMTITYNHDHLDPSPLFSFVADLNILPRPAGVSVSVNTI
jgi:hypothetical protein